MTDRKEQHRELDEKVRAFYAELGLRPEQIEEALATPHHFSGEEWRALEEIKEQVREKLGLPQSFDLSPQKKGKKKKSSRSHRAPWFPI